MFIPHTFGPTEISPLASGCNVCLFCKEFIRLSQIFNLYMSLGVFAGILPFSYSDALTVLPSSSL